MYQAWEKQIRSKQISEAYVISGYCVGRRITNLVASCQHQTPDKPKAILPKVHALNTHTYHLYVADFLVLIFSLHVVIIQAVVKSSITN